MRLIDFKAWLKKEKKMVSVITLHHPDHLNYFEYSTGQSSADVRSVQYEDAILVQFTGLKDKNKNKIYEGDILRETYSDGSGHKDVQVSFVINKEIFVGYELYADCNRYENVTGFVVSELNYPDHELFSSLNMFSVEIIGNIHENPELLGDKK